MRTPLVALTLALSLAGAGCTSRDALSKANVAVRTGSQNLSIQDLGALIANAKVNVQPTPQDARLVGNVWADYHRLGYAAAHDDSLSAEIDKAIAPVINAERVNLWISQLREQLPRDTATEAAFDSAAHGLYAVRHIVIAYPPKATALDRDSVVRGAATLRRMVTAGNFQELAKKYSAEKTTAVNGGEIGVVQKRGLNADAATAISRLKPDSVSGLVPTPFGFDIIQRMDWKDAKDKFVVAYSQATKSSDDSLIAERAASTSHLKVSEAIAGAARDAVAEPAKHAQDNTVLATYDNGGKFTVANLLEWVCTMPPREHGLVLANLPQESDSATVLFVRTVAIRGVLLHSADSAKIDIPEARKAEIRAQFRKSVADVWQLVGVSPAQLADSATSAADKERLASQRVDRFLAIGMAGTSPLPPIPAALVNALDEKYPMQTSLDAFARAATLAQMARQTDSLKTGSK